MTTKAPETIWLWRDGDRRCVSHPNEPAPEDSTRFVRADLYAAVVAERDALSQIVATGIDDVAGAGMDELEARAEAAEAALATAREDALREAEKAAAPFQMIDEVSRAILSLIDRKP